MDFFNPLKAIDKALDKGSNVLHRAATSVRNEFNDTTRAVRRTTSSAVNIARREIGETSQAVKRTTNNFANTARREIGETTQAVKRTTNSAVNTARREISETSQAVKRTTNNFANTARREWNETTQAARRTTNNVANTARREWNETTQAVRRTTNNVANTARREWNETTQAVRRTTNSAVNTARREIGETSQAVSRTARNVANTARQVNLSDVGHTVLDGAGFIPVVGAAADVANGAWYAAEGDWKNAGFSFGAAVPGVGDAVAAARGVNRLTQAASFVGRATDVAGVAEGGINSVQYAREGDWRNAGSALGSTFIGGVNTSRVPRRPGTVSNVTGDATAAGRRLEIEGRPISRAAIEAGPRRPAIEAGPRRLAIEAGPGTTMRPIYERGIRPNPLRDERGRFAPNPDSPLTRESKHKSVEYRRAQDQLKRETIDDDKAPRHIRAWLEQERKVRGNNPRNWRNPKGYDTGHFDPNDNTRLRWETTSQNRSRGGRFGR